MKTILSVLFLTSLLISCGEFEAQKLELSDAEIQGYWVIDAVATKTEFDDAATKCSIITSKPNSGEKVYPKAYFVRGREIAVVYTDPAKSEEPLDAFASIAIDGTVSSYHNDTEGLQRLIPTPNPDQMKMQVLGQASTVLVTRISADNMTKIQKIVKDCN